MSQRSSKINNPEKKLLHWKKIIVAACEQCGRNHLPYIHAAQDLECAVSTETEATKIVLDPKSISTFAQLPTPKKNIHLLIGSEGGLSSEEIQHAVDQKFFSVSLGPRILRTETASLAALSIILHRWDHFG